MVKKMTGKCRKFLAFFIALTMVFSCMFTFGAPVIVLADTPFTINDNDEHILYYQFDYYSNRGNNDYNNDVHAGTKKGSYFQYSFIGTGIEYVAPKYINYGDVDVYIDGVFQGTYSTYSSSYLSQQVIFSRTDLTLGGHVIKCVNSATTAENPKYVCLDSLRVHDRQNVNYLSPSAAHVDSSTVIDDNSGSITYNGFSAGQSNSRDYNSTCHIASSAGAYFQCTVTGPTVILYFEQYTDSGKIQVMIDGVNDGPVIDLKDNNSIYHDDTYTSQPTTCGGHVRTTPVLEITVRQYQVPVYVKTGLSTGSHTLRVVTQDGSPVIFDYVKCGDPTVGYAVNQVFDRSIPVSNIRAQGRLAECINKMQDTVNGWLGHMLTQGQYGYNGDIIWDPDPNKLHKIPGWDSDPYDGATVYGHSDVSHNVTYSTIGTTQMGRMMGSGLFYDKANSFVSNCISHQLSNGYLGVGQIPGWEVPDYEDIGLDQLMEVFMSEYKCDPPNTDKLKLVKNFEKFQTHSWLGDNTLPPNLGWPGTTYPWPAWFRALADWYKYSKDQYTIDRLKYHFNHYYGAIPSSFTDNLAACHGVLLANKIGNVASMYRVTGDPALLSYAKDFVHKAIDYAMTATGAPHANENYHLKDYLSSHEHCSIVDWTILQSRLARLTGGVEYADNAERAYYNAYWGSKTKDAGLLQYLSSPNQIDINKNSHYYFDTYYMNGQLGTEIYPHCCNADTNKEIPQLFENSVLKLDDGSGLAVVYYAPVSITTAIGGSNVTIDQMNDALTAYTDYPFEDAVKVKVTIDTPSTFPIYFRIPGWCGSAQVSVNGTPVSSTAVVPGAFTQITRQWSNNDVVRIQFDIPVTFDYITKSGRVPGVAVQRGALTYVLPCDSNSKVTDLDTHHDPNYWHKQEKHSVNEASVNWNVALMIDDIRNPGASVVRMNHYSGTHAFSNPPVSLVFHAKEVTNWHQNQRNGDPVTPELPTEMTYGDGSMDVELVPLGFTNLRMTYLPVYGLDEAGPRGYWKLDEDSGTTAGDSSGKGHNAAVSGATWVTGAYKNALSLDGVNAYMQINDSYNPTAATISMWVKTPSAVTNKNIFYRTDSNPDVDRSHQLYIDSSGRFTAHMFDGASHYVTGTTVVAANTWYHVTVAAKNNGQLKLYVNGQPEGTPVDLGTMWASGDRYYVGRGCGYGLGYFSGVVDDVRLYSRELNAGEIKSMVWSMTDMALGKTAAASSYYNNDPMWAAGKAVDGNSSTRWASQGNSNEWIYVDLGSVCSINRVRLKWEAAYASAYKIQTSFDASTWTDIYNTTSGDGGMDDLTGLSGSGRYVRIYCITPGVSAFSLWDFKAYGCPLVELALGKPAAASSSYSSSYTADKAVDGNSSTRWASAGGSNEWIYVDLGANYNINRVKLNWEAAYASSYKIQTSFDASTWTDIYSTTSGGGSTEDLTGLSGSGRYVKINCITTGPSSIYSLWNFEVYGSLSEDLALGKTAAASSYYNNDPTWAAGKAVDGSSSTRWASQGGTNEWIYIDLGANYNIRRVKLNWEAAYGRSYKIQTSSDAINWTDIYSTTSGDGGIDDLTGLSGSGRYVRMLGITGASIFSLWDFEVYNS